MTSFISSRRASGDESLPQIEDVASGPNERLHADRAQDEDRRDEQREQARSRSRQPSMMMNLLITAAVALSPA